MSEITVKFNWHGVVRAEDIMQEINEAIQEHNNEGHRTVRDLLEISLKTKTLITLVKDQHRGFGKSTALAEKARELGAVLIVPRNLKYFYEGRDDNSHVKCYVSPQQARGVRFNSGFMVDEGIDPEVIKELSRNNEFLGGFNRL